MKQYIELVAHVIKNGTKQANRTGVNTISFPASLTVRVETKVAFLRKFQVC
jgi:thymidylate synthase